jgi:hypothetical protein
MYSKAAFSLFVLLMTGGWGGSYFKPSSITDVKKDRSALDIPFNIESILPAGYVKNGTEDYTNYVQEALYKYRYIQFPGFPILVNDNGLRIKSDTRIIFMPGSKIILSPTAKSNYAIFQIRNVANVMLSNPVIIGDRYNHIGTSGEWGMGIGIYSSANITVVGAKVTNCWGDGIYIGRSKNSISPNRIRIINAFLDYNRRDGISVVSVDSLLLDSIYARNCNGTLPMSGINLEPESFNDDLLNIVMNNIKTENNAGNGIQVGYNKLYGGGNKQSEIKIINHTDINSNVAFKVSARISRRVNNEIIVGHLLVQNPNWRKNAGAPIQAGIFDNNIEMSITSPTVQNSDGKRLSKSQIKGMLDDKAHINSEANYKLNL